MTRIEQLELISRNLRYKEMEHNSLENSILSIKRKIDGLRSEFIEIWCQDYGLPISGQKVTVETEYLESHPAGSLVGVYGSGDGIVQGVTDGIAYGFLVIRVPVDGDPANPCKDLFVDPYDLMAVSKVVE